MAKSNQWVVNAGDSWGVRKEWSDRLTAKYDTQREAIDAGRQIARNQWVELFIQWRNGQIRERDFFGNDPIPPRG